jgi:hypothetical protein
MADPFSTEDASDQPLSLSSSLSLPCGNLSGMKTHLQSKMAECHHVLISNVLNHCEAWTFYFAIYQPSVSYPLPLCHFHKKELDKLHCKVMSKSIA